MGDVGRFKGRDLITPTEREARTSTRNREDGLVVLAEQLRQQASAENILLKLGEEGLLIHVDNGKGCDWLTDRVDALNAASKDVAGAGDSLLIASAMTLANPPGNLANGAVYILSAELLEKMSTELHTVKNFSTEVLHRFVGRIYSHETPEVFLDVGTPESYAQANS